MMKALPYETKNDLNRCTVKDTYRVDMLRNVVTGCFDRDILVLVEVDACASVRVELAFEALARRQHDGPIVLGGVVPSLVPRAVVVATRVPTTRSLAAAVSVVPAAAAAATPAVVTAIVATVIPTVPVTREEIVRNEVRYDEAQTNNEE